MDFTATQKFVRISPKKLRLVAGVARQMTPQEAIEKLSYLKKGGTEAVLKVVKTAVANAKEKEVGDDVLKFKSIQINEGPRLKRGLPVARGRWHPILKRMSHIKVVLTTVDKPKTEKTAVTKKVEKGKTKESKSKQPETKSKSEVKKAKGDKKSK